LSENSTSILLGRIVKWLVSYHLGDD